MIKKIFKYTFLSILIFFFCIFCLGLYLNEPLPEGESGIKADSLADEMLKSINIKGYDDLELIEWELPRGHRFKWFKNEKMVEVEWETYHVNLDTRTLLGNATSDGKELTGQELSNALNTAWQYFANDSFWLVAPFKVFDEGVRRTFVSTKEGNGLLVTYTSGGVTPGDSYLWILDENNRPIKWKMWVKIIPIGGMEVSWTNWNQINGVWFSSEHQFSIPYSFEINNIKVQ